MTKSRGVQWLEAQTGQELIRTGAEPGGDGRHLSVRVPVGLFERLERLAGQRGESVSQLARRLLSDGVERLRNPDREAIDQAIAALQQIREHLPTTAA